MRTGLILIRVAAVAFALVLSVTWNPDIEARQVRLCIDLSLPLTHSPLVARFSAGRYWPP